MNRLIRRIIGTIALLIAGVLLTGLNPTGLYRYPFNGYTTLAGTFGELRNNHFHSGIDIKTHGKTGIPIYAVQDGYMFRVKVSPFGFGHAIYLRHADGRFSVYAHLSSFTPPVKKYVKERQYATKEYSQELYPNREKFTFKQGDIIGYSGNSGSSVGPHLHFEIRDPSERILNSLVYYKHLVKDDVKPIVQHIAIEPIDPDSRVSGEFKKQILVPTGEAGHYKLEKPIDITGRVGIEYRAYDLLNAARNHCGINRARLFLDDNLIYEMDLQEFSFDEKQYINLHIDYQHYKRTKKRFERAYLEPGNKFNAYKNLKNWGLIDLSDNPDGQAHPFRLELLDGFENLTTVTGVLRNKETFAPLSTPPSFSNSPKVSYEINRNVLVLTATNPTSAMMKGIAYINPSGEAHKWQPTYAIEDKLVFLLPLRRPDYPVDILDASGRVSIQTGLTEELLPSQNNLVEVDEVQLYFPFESVFSSSHLSIKKSKGNSRMYSDIYEIGSVETPLNNSFLLNFKPKKSGKKEYMVIAMKDDKGTWKYAGNAWGEEGTLFASAGTFGEYCVMADSAGPNITPINFTPGQYIKSTQKSLRIKLGDTLSGIDDKTINCTLDGKWILFSYDYKKEVISHVLTQRPSVGNHYLKVNVSDEAGNLKTKTYSLSF